MVSIAVGLFCLIFGCVIGALLTMLLVAGSAGSASAAADRNELVEILHAQGVPDDVIVKCLEKGLNKWAQWRLKTRPALWRFGFDWPEYSPTTEAELEEHYTGFIPEPPPDYAPSAQLSAPSSEWSEDGQPDSLDASQIESLQAEQKSSSASEGE